MDNTRQHELELLARVAYAAYVEARSADLDTPKMRDWPELRPAAKNAWCKACQEIEGDMDTWEHYPVAVNL